MDNREGENKEEKAGGEGGQGEEEEEERIRGRKWTRRRRRTNKTITQPYGDSPFPTEMNVSFLAACTHRARIILRKMETCERGPSCVSHPLIHACLRALSA